MSRINKDEDIALSKTALRIYMHLVESGKPLGPREIARNLGLSPSLVYYHLKRLEELGIVLRMSDGYIVKKVIPIEGFIAIRRKFIPRMFLYGMLFLGILTGEVITIVLSRGINIERIMLLCVTILATAILFLEAMNIKKRLRL